MASKGTEELEALFNNMAKNLDDTTEVTQKASELIAIQNTEALKTTEQPAPSNRYAKYKQKKLGHNRPLERTGTLKKSLSIPGNPFTVRESTSKTVKYGTKAPYAPYLTKRGYTVIAVDEDEVVKQISDDLFKHIMKDGTNE